MLDPAIQDNAMGPWAPRHVSWFEMGCYFGGAMLVAALGTWWILQRGGRLGLDEPDARRKLHEKAVSRLGGAPIFLAVGLASLVAGYIGGLGWTRRRRIGVSCRAMLSITVKRALPMAASPASIKVMLRGATSCCEGSGLWPRHAQFCFLQIGLARRGPRH